MTNPPADGVGATTPPLVRTAVLQDRSRLFLSSLRLILTARGGVTVAATVEAVDELPQLAARHRAGVVVLEAGPTPWELEPVLDRLCRLEPAPVLVGVGRPAPALAGHFDGGVLARHAPVEDILAAVTGQEAPTDPLTPAPNAPRLLSGAELQVLAFLSVGLSTNQMAERMGRSPRSVRALRERVLARLNAQSGPQAVAEGIRQGLLGPRGGPS